MARINHSRRVGEAFETLAAGTYADLTARANRPQTCIRRLQCLTATNISVMADAQGRNSAPGSVPAGTTIDADISAITVDQTVLVFW